MVDTAIPTTGMVLTHNLRIVRPKCLNQPQSQMSVPFPLQEAVNQNTLTATIEQRNRWHRREKLDPATLRTQRRVIGVAYLSYQSWDLLFHRSRSRTLGPLAQAYSVMSNYLCLLVIFGPLFCLDTPTKSWSTRSLSLSLHPTIMIINNDLPALKFKRACKSLHFCKTSCT